jgi:protein TonB
MRGCRGCLALGALASAALHGAVLVSWLRASEPAREPLSEQALTLDLALFAPGPQAGPTETAQADAPSAPAPPSPPTPATEPESDQAATPVVAALEASDPAIADTPESPEPEPKVPDTPEPPSETPSPAPPEPLAALTQVPDPTPEPDLEARPEPPAVPKEQSRPKPEPKPGPKAEPKPKPAAKAKPKRKPAPKPKPKATPKAEPKPTPTPKRDIGVATAPKDRAPAQTGKGDAKGRTAARSTGASAAEKARAEQAYLAELQRAIGRHQRFPEDARKRRKTGTATLSFVIKSDGRIRAVRLAKSSGDASLDKAALQALHRLNRFKPIPGAIGRSSWSLRVPIRFDLR